MGYLDQDRMASNTALASRVAQCAAEQDAQPDPDSWTFNHRREWSAAPGWDDAWASALVSNEETPEYDPGTDEGVITDSMILSQVQAMLAEAPA